LLFGAWLTITWENWLRLNLGYDPFPEASPLPQAFLRPCVLLFEQLAICNVTPVSNPWALLTIPAFWGVLLLYLNGRVKTVILYASKLRRRVCKRGTVRDVIGHHSALVAMVTIHRTPAGVCAMVDGVK
jgi:hypothetical protein